MSIDTFKLFSNDPGSHACNVVTSDCQNDADWTFFGISAITCETVADAVPFACTYASVVEGCPKLCKNCPVELLGSLDEGIQSNEIGLTRYIEQGSNKLSIYMSSTVPAKTFHFSFVCNGNDTRQLLKKVKHH